MYRCGGEGLPPECRGHWRPEEGVRCPGAVVTSIWKPTDWVLGSELLTAEPSPQTLNIIPHFCLNCPECVVYVTLILVF